MTLTLFTALLTFAFVTLVTPGPNNLMLMASGMNFGYRRTFPHLSGIAIGFSVMVFLVGIGIVHLLELIPYGQLILKASCTLYLFYLAWKIATSVPLDTEQNKSGKTGKPLTVLQAALFQWVNPKAWTMALTAVSVYTPHPQRVLDVLIVASVYAVMVYPFNSLWILLGQQLRPLLNAPKKMRAFNMTCAILLILSLYPILSGSFM